MDANRWQRLEDLFIAALDQDASTRDAFLATATGDDHELHAEVVAMLSAHVDGVALAAEAQLLTDSREDEGPAAVDPRIGTQVHAWRLVRRIGRGGMGDVYLGERSDGEYTQTVAIKLLRRDSVTDDLARRFRAERQILARLDHPNITRLLDGGTTDHGELYLVMEQVEGEPITAYCDRRRLGIDDRLRLFLTVCDAVQYAHASLVVHRDLKPANVLVTQDGRVKLLDFGIAKLLAGPESGTGQAETRTGLMLLTPDHAAPEQISGGNITTATDVYGLGLLLYQLLTGAHPFGRDGGALETARAIVEDEPVRPAAAVMRGGAADAGNAETARARGLTPADLSRRLQDDLDTITLKTLRKEPERRYSSVDQLAEDVSRHLRHFPILARNETRVYRIRKFVRRNRLPSLRARSPWPYSSRSPWSRSRRVACSNASATRQRRNATARSRSPACWSDCSRAQTRRIRLATRSPSAHSSNRAWPAPVSTSPASLACLPTFSMSLRRRSTAWVASTAPHCSTIPRSSISMRRAVRRGGIAVASSSVRASWRVSVAT